MIYNIFEGKFKYIESVLSKWKIDLTRIKLNSNLNITKYRLFGNYFTEWIWNIITDFNLLITKLSKWIYTHSWNWFTENDPRRNIAQLWKLFSYITIMILKISFRNSLSSLLSSHYMTFLFTGPFDLTKAQSL